MPEKEEEKPVVVVLKTGDLTAEEAELEKKQIDEGDDLFYVTINVRALTNLRMSNNVNIVHMPLGLVSSMAFTFHALTSLPN